MKILFIINPTAGKGTAKKSSKKLKTILQKKSIFFDFFSIHYCVLHVSVCAPPPPPPPPNNDPTIGAPPFTKLGRRSARQSSHTG